MDRALLVGINECSHNRLSGCVNDVLDVQGALVGRYGFAEDDILCLTNARATKRNILDRLRRLVRGLRPGDRALFHYSGLERGLLAAAMFVCMWLVSASAQAADGCVPEPQNCNDNTQACRDALQNAAEALREKVLQEAGELVDELDRIPRLFDAAATRIREEITLVRGDAMAIAAVAEAVGSQEPLDALKRKYSHECETASQDIDNAKQFMKLVKVWDREIRQLCMQSCTSDGTFCIEATTGEPFCRNTKDIPYYHLPETAEPNASFVVRVMGLADTGGVIELSTSVSRSRDTLTPRGSEFEKMDIFADDSSKPPGPSFTQLKDDFAVQIPDDSSLQSFAIVFRWTPDAGDRRKAAQRQFTIDVDQGKYYVEVGLLLPFILDGTRTVAPMPLPGTAGERRITITEDSLVSPALAVNLFPWGRRQGRVSALYPSFRLGDLVGLQAGLNLDLTRAFDRLYLGAVIEPVAGLSMTTGLAMVKGQFVPDGYAAHMIVSKDEAFTPDTKYMPRFYLGFTVTNRVLTTIIGAADAVRKSAGAP